MKLTLKLFSSLMEYLPAEVEGNTLEITVGSAKSCNDLIARYKIPIEAVQIVMLNGAHLAPEARDDLLQDGDIITIWPAIQGG